MQPSLYPFVLTTAVLQSEDTLHSLHLVPGSRTLPSDHRFGTSELCASTNRAGYAKAEFVPQVEPLEDVLLIKKSLLEIEKEAAAESATHTKIKSPTRSELHKKCACIRAGWQRAEDSAS